MPHGGKRAGAGRPKGSRSAATVEHQATIAELAREHCPDALAALAKIVTSGQSESAIVAAANSLLDRGYGKPVQTVDNTSSDGTMSPQPAIDARQLKTETLEDILNAATDKG